MVAGVVRVRRVAPHPADGRFLGVVHVLSELVVSDRNAVGLIG
jgi:hypothetical protein